MIKVGDKIRILKEGLDDANVHIGQILSVTRVFGDTVHAIAQGHHHSWRFAVSHLGTGFELVSNSMPEVLTSGLTKREYFAGLALQGIISSGTSLNNSTPNAAVALAEALIAALNEGEE